MVDGRITAPAREITAALTLMAVRVALGAAAAVAQLADATAVRSAIGTANPPLTGPQVDAVYGGIVGVAVIAGLCYAGLYAALIVHIRRGSTWARNTARLLAGLSALAALGSLREAGPTIGHPLAVAVLLVDAAVLTLLTVPAAGRHFTRPADPAAG
jgi:hypothetical protein